MKRTILVLPVMLMLAMPAAATTVCDAVWHDAARARDVPVRIRMPDGRGTVAAVLWSPGLGGDIHGGGAWADAWVSQGLAVIHLQHPGSDSAVYQGEATREERRARVLAAATPAQLIARVADVGFVADELARRPREGACNLGRVDRERLGLAGHSMGAWTVQGVAGQRFGPMGEAPLTDRRFRALIAFSPTGNADAAGLAAFAGVRRPFLAITGTADGAPINATPEQRAQPLLLRTAPFRGMPADGRKYQLVFDRAEHMMFAGNAGRARTDPLAGHVLTASIAVTQAFWNKWLLENDKGDAVLERPPIDAADRWEHK